MKTALKVLAMGLAMGLLGATMAYLAGLFEPKISKEHAATVADVTGSSVITVETIEVPVIEQAAGTIRAKVETVISPLITATISSLAVRAGDEVKPGDVLVELDARELEARVDQAHQAVVAAEARSAQVERDLRRIQRIYAADPGAVSKAELDRTQAALRTARAEATRLRRLEDETKTALTYSTLAAPFAGRVVDRLADPGDTARQGVPLLRLYDPGSLRLEANVREQIASGLHKGQTLRVTIDALDRQLDAVVDEIVPSADPGSRSFLVKVSLTADADLFPGMFGRLLIPVGQRRMIALPVEAVTQAGQLDFVMVKTPQGPARRFVRLGSHPAENRVEIVSGLAPGEKVILPAP